LSTIRMFFCELLYFNVFWAIAVLRQSAYVLPSSVCPA